MEGNNYREEQVFRLMLGHWEGSTRVKGTYPYDRLTLSVAESGIIIEHYSQGKSMGKEIHSLKGSRLESSDFILSSSLYYARNVAGGKMLLGKYTAGPQDGEGFLLEMRKVSGSHKIGE